MKKFILKSCHCVKCGHDWYPRKPQRPFVCPKCHKYTWEGDKCHHISNRTK